MRIRHLAALVLAVAGTACAGPKIEQFAGTTPTLTPEGYFAGRTAGWGFVRDFYGRYRAEFTVDITGRMEGDRLVLDERFSYADGREDTRVWQVTRRTDGVYEGTADDVVGTAEGRAAGRMMQWVYEIDLPVDDETFRVRFDDWLFYLEQGTLLGRTTIEKYGFPIGEIVILFRKVPETGRTLVAEAR